MRIGEAAAAAGMTTKTLRFYEGSGLLTATERAANGYREYSQDAVERLGLIRRGRAAGLRLAQIRTILEIRGAGDSPCRHVRQILAGQLGQLDHRIAELQALRAVVSDLQESLNRVEDGTWMASTDLLIPLDSCPHCSGLDAPGFHSLTGTVNDG